MKCNFERGKCIDQSLVNNAEDEGESVGSNMVSEVMHSTVGVSKGVNCIWEHGSSSLNYKHGLQYCGVKLK